MENRFLVAGEILAVDDGVITLETIERRPPTPQNLSGEYPDQHQVYIEDATTRSPGDRVAIIGTIGQDEFDGRKLVLKGEAMKDHNSKRDLNIARIDGRLDRSFEHFEAVPEEGKRGFGNLLMIIDDTFYLRGVVLQAAQAIKIDRAKKFYAGAEIQIEGRLQTRAFTSNDEDRVALEIVVSKAEVLVPAPSGDLFDQFEKEMEKEAAI